MRNCFYVLLFALFFIACGDDDEGCPDVRAENRTTILDYIAENSIDAELGTIGNDGEFNYFFEITQAGTGDQPFLQNSVRVNYTLTNLEGDVLDQGTNSVFPLQGVVTGFQRGVREMTEGSTATIIVPAHLGYGCNPPTNSDIGVNEILIFEVELIDVI